MPGLEFHEFDEGCTVGGARAEGPPPAAGEDRWPVAAGARGTLGCRFALSAAGMTEPQTVLAREGSDLAPGSFSVEVWPDGSVRIVHELEGGFVRFSTGPAFHAAGETVALKYSWDHTGPGGWLSVQNAVTGACYGTEVPDCLTLDLTAQAGPWVLGAAAGCGTRAFRGRILGFSLSDTVDTLPPGLRRTAAEAAVAQEGRQEGASTPFETPVTLAILADDDDPEGHTLAATALLQVTHGTARVNADGSVTFTPEAGFSGTATVDYEVALGAGGAGRASVAITVGEPPPAAARPPLWAESRPSSPGPTAPPQPEAVSPCFTPGTLIATPRGEMPVEMLRPGDQVVTRDNGIQEIRWIGQNPISGANLRLLSHLQPVRIKAHALGHGLPERDMMVSPNHRILVSRDRTQLAFDEPEVLVAAKHLICAEGVQSITSIGITYIHFLCDRHEVVLSNGAWTETFQPSDHSLQGLGNAQRNEIFELFPALRTPAGQKGWPSARRVLTGSEARLSKD